jgi:hypothetical protein
MYMPNEIECRYEGKGLHALSSMPGAASSGIQRWLPQDESAEYARENHMIMKSPEQGAVTIVLAAVGEQFEKVGAAYLENCEVAGLYPNDHEYDNRGLYTDRKATVSQIQ